MTHGAYVDHVQLRADSGRFYLFDLGSKAEQRSTIPRQQCRSPAGDVIRLGQTKMIYNQWNDHTVSKLRPYLRSENERCDRPGSADLLFISYYAFLVTSGLAVWLEAFTGTSFAGGTIAIPT